MSFTPLKVIQELSEICKKHNNREMKQKFTNLARNIGYCAPEIRESRFWNGNRNWFGLCEILNKHCVIISDCNIEILNYYKNMIKRYKENKGFDTLS
tara:strand:- start:1789 stop:2079 length:291 start_codon:yes stop_codon:yes gene_type:complete